MITDELVDAGWTYGAAYALAGGDPVKLDALGIELVERYPEDWPLVAASALRQLAHVMGPAVAMLDGLGFPVTTLLKDAITEQVRRHPELAIAPTDLPYARPSTDAAGTNQAEEAKP